VFENDIKKVVALSTLSQLGLMFFSIRLRMLKLALFHMACHAVFKALLFICVGTIIHFRGHSQDVRIIGAVRKVMPVTFRGATISVLSINAIPFISGFYSKDAIIESILLGGVRAVRGVLFFLSLFLT